MKINWKKSCLVGLNSDLEEFKGFSEALDYQTRALPIDYFGVPLGGNPRSRDFWLPVIDWYKRRLATWTANYLSFGGWITLIKATLSNLPVYYLIIFKIPERIAQELESLQKQFLWRGNANFKHHFITWEIASRPKKGGGLIIGGIRKRNIALLGKWLWRFPLEQSLLEASIIRSKFRHGIDGWNSSHLLHSTLRSPWNLSNLSSLLSSH